jgi:site-specific recombinase XerD
MTPLRQRMVEDMRVRNLSSSTRQCYVDRIAKFAKHFGRSPELLGPEDIRTYQVYLACEKNVSWSLLNQTVCALRFLYRVTLRKNWIVEHIPFAKKEHALPVVLTLEEVARFFRAIPNIKHRAVLVTAYATGLRISEVTSLCLVDVDSKRMLIRIQKGKGRRDRFVMLSPNLLHLLRGYWKVVRPRYWLFPGRPDRHISAAMIQRVCRQARVTSGLTKQVTPRSLRHSFATHLLESGANVRTIQILLGHRSLQTTARYTHVSAQTVCATVSPLDLIDKTIIDIGNIERLF